MDLFKVLRKGKRAAVFRPHKEFSKAEQRSGILLLLAMIFSLILANSPFSELYMSFWHNTLGVQGFGESFSLSLEQWINDGLMTIFFLVVGLEIKRELTIGELSSVKKATLPMLGALGGMIAPALIYIILARDTQFSHGWGIPMATDIAFALGIISMLGNRVPVSIKIFLTALAVTDDLGAIIVIAVAYTSDVSMFHLCIALAIFVSMLIMNRCRVSNFIYYIMAGGVMWYFMLKSGVHATLSGVLTAFAIPSYSKFREFKETAIIEHRLHEFSTFVIMPLFALVNTSISLKLDYQTLFSSPLNHAVVAGLLLGKPLGIISFSVIAIKLKIGDVAESIRLRHIIGAGFLGGIGFTMSIFISMLAFGDVSSQLYAKVSILIGSLLSGLSGFMILRTCKPVKFRQTENLVRVDVDSENDDI